MSCRYEFFQRSSSILIDTILVRYSSSLCIDKKITIVANWYILLCLDVAKPITLFGIDKRLLFFFGILYNDELIHDSYSIWIDTTFISVLIQNNVLVVIEFFFPFWFDTMFLFAFSSYDTLYSSDLIWRYILLKTETHLHHDMSSYVSSSL